MQQRQQIGMAIAKQAAQILKEQFHVDRVAVFGSLLNVESMHEHSDIDIAVWGLADEQLLSAWATLDSSLDFQSTFPYIDLVPAERTFSYIQGDGNAYHMRERRKKRDFSIIESQQSYLSHNNRSLSLSAEYKAPAQSQGQLDYL